MCRAIAVIAVVPDEISSRRLHIAVGSEAEIVGVAMDLDEVTSLASSRTFDVAVVDGRSPDGEAVLRTLAGSFPNAGIVWIGENIPPGSHATVSPERLIQDLPRGIARALTTHK